MSEPTNGIVADQEVRMPTSNLSVMVPKMDF